MSRFTYDGLLATHLGYVGRYQLLIATLASLDSIPYAAYTLGPVFIASTQPHYCVPEALSGYNCSRGELVTWAVAANGCRGKEQSSAGQCIWKNDPCRSYKVNASTGVSCEFDEKFVSRERTSTEPCTAWVYGDSFYPNSAVTEWDLVCDQQTLASTISGAYMLGRLAGSLLLGSIADIFGRRKAMLSLTALTFVCALSSGLVTNIYAFLALRFMIAFFDMARSNVGFILGVEYLHSSKRAFFAGYWGTFWVIGIMILASTAYFIQQWRHLVVILAIPEIIIFIIHFIALPESPRWLLLKNRKQEARDVVEKMARFNNSKLPDNWDITAEEKALSSATFVDLLKAPHIRLITLVMAFIFFANGLVFYGLSMSTSNLAGNEYFNFFISGAVELPAYIFVAAFYDRINRRPLFCTCLVLGGVLLMLTLAVPAELGWLVIVLSMTGKFCITLSFIMTWLVVTELFPTCIRGVALGITNGTARLAAFLSAYIYLLVTFHTALPSVIFSVAAILAGLLVVILPETQGMGLQQSIPEGEAFLKENMCKLSTCRKRNRVELDKDVTNKASASHETVM